MPVPPTSALKRGAAVDDSEIGDSALPNDEIQAGSDMTRKKSGGLLSADASEKSPNATLPMHAGSSSAIINVYHDGDALKMFDTVEFFGVLAVASLDSSLTGECDDGFNMTAPPASAVPRFHAITYRRFNTSHPVTCGSVCSFVPHVPVSAVPALAASAKAAFTQSICAALACDVDCATQTLLCLMSNIQDRVSGEAIGSYSLNLRLPASSTNPASRGRFVCVFFDFCVVITFSLLLFCVQFILIACCSALFADGVAGCNGSSFVVDRLWQLLCAVLPARRRIFVSIPSLNQVIFT